MLGTALAAALPEFRIHLIARNLLAAFQLLQSDFNLVIQSLLEGGSVFAEREPIEQGLRLSFVQVFDFSTANSTRLMGTN